MKTAMNLLKSIAPFILLLILTFCIGPKSEKTIEGEQLIAELSSTWSQSDIEITKNHPVIKSVELINDSIAEFCLISTVGQNKLTGKWKFKFNSRNELDIELKSDVNVKQLQTDAFPYNLLITYGKKSENMIKLPVAFGN